MKVPTIDEVTPLVGTGTEAVISAVRTVLGRGDVLSLTIVAAESAIHYARVATAEEAEARSNLTYHDVVRSKPMEEYVASEGLTPYQQLFEMFEVLYDAGFAPILLMSGRPLPELRSWLGLMSRKARTLYGVRIVVDEGIPEDNLILCGGTGGTDDSPDAIKYSVKVTLP